MAHNISFPPMRLHPFIMKNSREKKSIYIANDIEYLYEKMLLLKQLHDFKSRNITQNS